MAKDPNAPFEMPTEVRAVAELSIEEARKAFDQVLNSAKASLSAVEHRSKAAQQGAKDISATVMALAEQNVFSAFDYAQKLIQAKDPQTLMQLQIDFIKAQMQGLSEQAKVLGETVSKAASEAVKKN
ncbi:MAG: phasin family protein [Xanthobacteraceae bacterium]